MTREGQSRGRVTVGWTALSVLGALLLVGLSVVDPLLTLGASFGGALLLLAAFRPKVFAVVALVVVILSVPIQNTVGTVGGYADEAMVALVVVAFGTRRLLTRGGLVLLPGIWWFFAFLVMGVLSALVNGVPVSVWAPGAVIAVKAVLFAFALAQLEWTEADLRRGIRVGVLVVAVQILTGLVNLVVPGPWAALTTGRPPLNYVAGIPSVNGLFQHPAAFSRLSVVLAVATLAYAVVVRRSLGALVLLAATAALTALTFQVKSLVSLLAGVALVGLRYARPAEWLALLAVAPIVAVFVVPPVAELVSIDFELYFLTESARLQLAAGSLTLAALYAPFGAGFGRYGSSTAADNYSPEYYRLGFDDVFGLGPGDDGRFLNDNQWPAILGETGYVGAVCFAIGTAVAVTSLLRRIRADEPPLLRWIRITGIGWALVLLVESVASPVFVSAPAYPFLFAAVGIVAAIRSTERRKLETETERDPNRSPTGVGATGR